MTKSKIRKDKLLAYAVAFVPLLLNYYAVIPQILISDIVIISSGIVVFAGGYHKLPRSIIFAISIFALWILLISLYQQMASQPLSDLSGLFLPARILLYYFLSIPVGLYLVNKGVLEETVIFLSILFAIYSFIQLAVYYATGITLITGIPFLSQRFGLEIFNNGAEIFDLFGYRPSSFFTEPAHLSQYCAIGALLLVSDHQRSGEGAGPRFFFAKISLLLTAPLAAGSGTAAFSVLFVISVIFVLIIRISIIRQAISSKFLSLFIVALAVGVLAFIFDAQAILRVTNGIFSGSFISETSALFVRVLRPFSYISVLLARGDLSGLAFGYGYGAYESLLNTAGLTTVYENSSQVYWVNTFGLTISAVGFIGFLLFTYVFASIFFSSSMHARSLVIYLFASLFFSDMAASGFAFLIFTLALSMRINGSNIHHSRSLERRS